MAGNKANRNNSESNIKNKNKNDNYKKKYETKIYCKKTMKDNLIVVDVVQFMVAGAVRLKEKSMEVVTAQDIIKYIADILKHLCSLIIRQIWTVKYISLLIT